MNFDQISKILSYPEIHNFLKLYPKQQWSEVLFQTLLIGIKAQKRSQVKRSPRVDQSKKIFEVLPGLQSQLREFSDFLTSFEKPAKKSSRKEAPILSARNNRDVISPASRPKPKKIKKRRPWMEDFTDFMKDKKKSSPKASYQPPDYPIYEPNLRAQSLESHLLSPFSSPGVLQHGYSSDSYD